jgi:Helix-turn-helix domain
MKSYTWRNAINKSDLPPTTRHVLQTLSDHLNTTGRGAFPSQKTLAKEAGLAERTVKRHLSIAAKAGWIKVKKHGFSDRRSRTNEYFPQIPDMGIVGPHIEGHGDRGSPYQDDMGIVDPGHGDRGSPKSHDMGIVDPLRSKEKTATSESTSQFQTIELSPNYEEELTTKGTTQKRELVTPSPPSFSSSQKRKLDKGLSSFDELQATYPWLDIKAWGEFRQHRKEVGKPLTYLSEQKTIEFLNKLRVYESQQDIINRSIINGWPGLYPERSGGGNRVNGTEFKSIQQLRHEALVRANRAEGEQWLAQMAKQKGQGGVINSEVTDNGRK